MSAKIFCQGILLLFASFWAELSYGKPWASELFCQSYPASPSCAGTTISCSFCHKAQPPALNNFGACMKHAIKVQADFPTTPEDFRAAVELIQDEDCDSDGFSNMQEIQAGQLPGDERKFPTSNRCNGRSLTDPLTGPWKLCAADSDYVWKKIWLDVCGEPPSYPDYMDFKKRSDSEKTTALSDQLDQCLKSNHWRGKDGVVWEIGQYKIRPVGSVKAGEDPGVIPIVDYYADFHLFVYSQIDGHDARDQLLADYTVTRNLLGANRTSYTKLAPQRLLDGQVMQPDRRVGLLTTFWNLSFYLNYTGIARVLVAQAFNAYLGVSLAQMQGLNAADPALTGFADYDSKGVTRPECAQCHLAIDPLTYPFRNYNGLTGTARVLQGQSATPLQNLANLGDETNLTPLSYALPRMEFLDQQFPGIKNMPEVGYIFGQRVANLREWATVMANSDMFAANTVKDYWIVMVGHEPRSDEMKEFEKLWRDFKGVHQYSVKAMLHDLIQTEAYSVP